MESVLVLFFLFNKKRRQVFQPPIKPIFFCQNYVKIIKESVWFFFQKNPIHDQTSRRIRKILLFIYLGKSQTHTRFLIYNKLHGKRYTKT